MSTVNEQPVNSSAVGNGDNPDAPTTGRSADRIFRRAALRAVRTMGQKANVRIHDTGTRYNGVNVHIQTEEEQNGDQSTTRTVYRDVAELLVSEIPEVSKRDTIQTNTGLWHVDAKISNDGYIIRVQVSRD
ncbi:MAG: hypothetical protein ACPGF7_09570 [Pontibacterium sp.]